jgi:hypothetical protein
VNDNDVVILEIVGERHHGSPGGSALEGFRSARARQRRVRATALLGVFVACAVGIAALAAGTSTAVQAIGVGILLAGAVVGLIAWGVGGDVERWRRGASAEQVTARHLAHLSSRRWSVWHDLRVPGSRANIDHVVIGPTGVWVVDTKSTLTSVRATWWSVRFGDRRLDTTATRWEAGIVADRLGVPVRPIVAVHGSHMRRRAARAQGVPVVRADRLVPRLRRGRRRFPIWQVDEMAARLVEEFDLDKAAGRRG